ncbi:hypothetical protein acdb102_42280 [Acidothermaceae bacterium B102]|nr:hypothetical protein acdb102_42280 [Acidothermaceae bacterium B102]
MRLRALWLATYRVRSIAARTASAASGLTSDPPLSTRDTVDRDTPASAATSRIVGGLDMASLCPNPPLLLRWDRSHSLAPETQRDLA